MNNLNKSTDVKQLFLDGIGEIHFLNNNVRTSWGTFIQNSIDNTQNNEPFFKYELRTILPLTSFLSALRAQYDLYLKLVENNIVPEGTLEKISEQSSEANTPDLVLK